MQINQLIYQSSATIATTPHQLQQLLPAWRASNHSAGISGLLLYGEESIMQILEGEADKVHELYQLIACDLRHFNVQTLADGFVPRRAFSQWSMGFVQLDAPEMAKLTGYVSPAQPAGLLPDQPQHWPELLELLQEFAVRERQLH
ncbi:MAG: BLUF domain-containing protein [Hymenobacter sp.]|nr:MAG: BLUF domain-containing protein [Hymenobacter sp.]